MVYSKRLARGMKNKVLVVEDEPIILLGLIGLMEERGFEVLDAPNADTALGIFDAHPDIDVVISDVDMPGSIDGIDLAYHVRDRSEGTGIVIISGKVGLKDLALPDGTRFFTKPCSDQELSRAVDMMLADGGMRQ